MEAGWVDSNGNVIVTGIDNHAEFLVNQNLRFRRFYDELNGTPDEKEEEMLKLGLSNGWRTFRNMWENYWVFRSKNRPSMEEIYSIADNIGGYGRFSFWGLNGEDLGYVMVYPPGDERRNKKFFSPSRLHTKRWKPVAPRVKTYNRGGIGEQFRFDVEDMAQLVEDAENLGLRNSAVESLKSWVLNFRHNPEVISSTWSFEVRIYLEKIIYRVKKLIAEAEGDPIDETMEDYTKAFDEYGRTINRDVPRFDWEHFEQLSADLMEAGLTELSEEVWDAVHTPTDYGIPWSEEIERYREIQTRAEAALAGQEGDSSEEGESEEGGPEWEAKNLNSDVRKFYNEFNFVDFSIEPSSRFPGTVKVTLVPELTSGQDSILRQAAEDWFREAGYVIVRSVYSALELQLWINPVIRKSFSHKNFQEREINWPRITELMDYAYQNGVGREAEAIYWDAGQAPVVDVNEIRERLLLIQGRLEELIHRTEHEEIVREYKSLSSSRTHTKAMENNKQNFSDVLASKLNQADNKEWYLSLLALVCSKTDNFSQAFEVADQLYQESPNPPSDETDEALKVVADDQAMDDYLGIGASPQPVPQEEKEENTSLQQEEQEQENNIANEDVYPEENSKGLIVPFTPFIDLTQSISDVRVKNHKVDRWSSFLNRKSIKPPKVKSGTTKTTQEETPSEQPPQPKKVKIPVKPEPSKLKDKKQVQTVIENEECQAPFGRAVHNVSIVQVTLQDDSGQEVPIFRWEEEDATTGDVVNVGRWRESRQKTEADVKAVFTQWELEPDYNTASPIPQEVESPPEIQETGTLELGTGPEDYADQQEVDNTYYELFGNATNPDKKIASIIGAIGIYKDAKLTIIDSGTYYPPYSDDLPLVATGIRVKSEHPTIENDGWLNFVGVDDNNEKFLCIELIKMKSPGGGAGLSIVVNQILQAKKMGLDYISMHAAGSWGGSMNGYYTWVMVGFDQTIDEIEMDDIKLRRTPPLAEKIRKRFPSAKSVSDIVNHEDGQKWWEIEGTDLLRAKFTLNENSPCWRCLLKYIKSKGGLEKLVVKKSMKF